MRIIVLTLYIWLAFEARYAAAQDASRPPAPSSACIQFNQSVLDEVAIGRLEDAETALSNALASDANGLEPLCAGFILHNMAVVMSLSGRLAEAESFADRSVKMLEKSYPPEDPVLLRPLALLSSAQFEQRKIGKARKVFQSMLRIRAERPDDRAVVHTMAGALLQDAAQYKEAELEYLKAAAAQEEAGRGQTSGMAALLNMLANLYIADRRPDEAGRMLDRALAIFATVKDRVPNDQIKTFNSEAAIHIQRGEWRKAEEVLRSAISTADREMRLDPLALETLLGNYAYVLRKSHRGREARTVEARAAAVHSHRTTDPVVDVSELFDKSKNAKK
ncbi:MAG: Tetratricopeptide 4 [Candidatus Solibacter sp.]|nr:Tetratricopeptide 4 [Candidatus Solibacter sp.]